MAPRIRIEPSTIAMTVEVRKGRSAGVVGDGVLRVVDGKEEGVDCVILLDVGATRLRYEVDSRPVGLCDLTILFVEETRRLFLGGRRLSSVVDLDRGTVDHPFEHCLFWGFDRVTRPGFILETGELDCLFRALDGRVLGHVPVDPPWESLVEPGGIRFESIVHGSQFLAFPEMVLTAGRSEVVRE
jgi:hypothetical protein